MEHADKGGAMARSRKTEEPSEEGTPLTARIRHLCEIVWDGNKSKMGRDLGGISHPVMSRVLSEQQAPPGNLLEALAKWPGLNVRWLFAGEGEPLSERNLGWGGGHFCPVARELLPGPPENHPELMTY